MPNSDTLVKKRVRKAVSLAIALESRMMFDAAAVATAAAVADNTDHHDAGQDAADHSANDVTAHQDRTAPEVVASMLDAEPGRMVVVDKLTDDGYSDIKGSVKVGDSFYVVRSSSTEEFVYNPVEPEKSYNKTIYSATLYRFDLDESGKLTENFKLEGTDENGLLRVNGLGASRDGKTLFVQTDNGVTLFSIGQDGKPTLQGTLTTSTGMVADLAIKGDHAYVATVDGLLRFHLDNGKWKQTGDPVKASEDGAWFTSLQFSHDNSLLFAAGSGGKDIATVYRVGNDGNLEKIDSVAVPDATEAFAKDLSLTPDGRTLYVVEANALHILSVADDGSLSIRQAGIALSQEPREIIHSDDGSLVALVGEKTVVLYSRQADGRLVKLADINNAAGNNGSTVSFEDIRGASFSADGRRAFLVGSFGRENGWGSDGGLLVVDLKPASVSYIEGKAPVALLPGGLLENEHLNAQNNYKGASIVVTRVQGDGSEDRFDFLNYGEHLKRVDNQILLDGTMVAGFVYDGQKVTVDFKADISRNDAQAILRRISYANTSQDPASQVRMSITLNDGNDASESLAAEIGIIAVNDAPVVNTKGNTGQYHAQSEGINLFKETKIDTVEKEQNISQVSVIVDAPQAGDVFFVLGDKIKIEASNGAKTTVSGLSYTLIMQTDPDTQTAQAKLTLFVNGTPERAASIIDSLAFAHQGGLTEGVRHFSLGVKDNGGSDDDFSGGRGSDTTILKDVATITLAPELAPNTAPEWSGTAAPDVSYVEKNAPVVLLPDTLRIADAQMDAYNGGKGNYDRAQLIVRLGEGHSDADILAIRSSDSLSMRDSTLMKDGRAIGTVSVTNGVLTLRFSDADGAIPTTADVNQVLGMITYANSSNVPAEQVAVSVVLADQVGLESSAQDFTIHITGVNDAPSISNDPVLNMGDLSSLQDMDLGQFNLSTIKASTLSASGDRFYLLDADGRIAAFAFNDDAELVHQGTYEMGDAGKGIGQMLAVDGGIYALQNAGDIHAITFISVDETGKPMSSRIVAGGDDDPKFGLVEMAASGDGRNLYVIESMNSSILIFERDAETGALDSVDEVTGDAFGQPALWLPNKIVVVGDYVYVLTSGSQVTRPSLIVYERDDKGELSPKSYVESGAQGAGGANIDLNDIRRIAVSADGRTIFVANSGINVVTNLETEETTLEPRPQRIDAFTFNLDSGTLTHRGTINDSPTVQEIAVSADGKALLVTRADGSLAYYSTEALEKLSSSREGLTGAGQIRLNADGNVIVLGEQMHVLQLQTVRQSVFQVGGEPVLPFSTLNLSDPELDAYGYGNARLTIQASLPGSVIGFGAGSYRLSEDGAEIVADGKKFADYQLSNNGQTLDIVFANGVTVAQATAVLRQINYAWSGGSVPDKAVLNLAFRDQPHDDGLTVTRDVDVMFGLPPEISEVVRDALGEDGVLQVDAGSRIDWQNIFSGRGEIEVKLEGEKPVGLSFDGANGGSLQGTLAQSGRTEFTLTATNDRGSTVSLHIVVNVANVPPSAIVEPLNPTYVERAEPLTVFANVELNVHGQGETVTGFVLRLDNVADVGHETLYVDGTSIVLRPGASGITTGGHIYAIVQDGASLRFTLKAASGGLEVSQAEAMLEGVAYASDSHKPSVDRPRVISLVEVSDSGSTAGGGSNTSNLTGRSSSITLISVNEAPQPSVVLPVLVAEIYQNVSYSLPAGLFVDPENDAMEIVVKGLPDGLVFDPATGIISGTPASSSIGTHQVHIQATDVHGASASMTMTLRVNLPLEGSPLSSLQPDDALTHELPVSSVATTPALATSSRQSDAGQRHQVLADAWAGVPGIEARPLGYSSLTMAGLSVEPGLRGLPFYLTDAPRSEWERELEQRRSDRPAATSLADHAGSTLHATRDAVRGTAQWDALQGQYQYQLPDGLFSGRQTLVSVVLTQADGSPLPEGIRLDARTGRIIVSGISGQWDLVLVAQTQEGRDVQVPVMLTVPESAADAAAAAGRPQAVATPAEDVSLEAKVAVSDQLRMQAAPSLAQDAQRLLAALGAEPQQDAAPDAQRIAA